MTTTLLRVTMALFLLSTTSGVLAQDQTTRETQVSLGYVGTTGNTETQSFNAEARHELAYGNFRHRIVFQALGSQEDGNPRAERYFLQNKTDYELGENRYAYLKGHYTDDRFSGFEYQAAVSGGLGHYFYDRDDFMLEGFAGIGYRHNSVREAETNGLSSSEGEAILSLGQTLDWDLSESSAITQSLLTEIGTELTVTRFEIGLTNQIFERLSSKIAFQIRNTSEVPVGRENTDTQTSISLVYDF